MPRTKKSASAAEASRETDAPSRSRRAPRTELAHDDAPFVGVQLRHYRMLRRLKLKELAELVDCSESLLSRIENNRLNPSFSTLRKLCKALEINVGQLLSMGDETLCTTYEQGTRPVIGRTRLRADLQKVAAEVFIPYTDGRLLEGFVMVFEPGGGSNGKVSHRGEEAGYVVEGQLRLVVDNETWLLGPGATFFFRSDVPHEYSNPGTTVTRVVWINTPPSI